MASPVIPPAGMPGIVPGAAPAAPDIRCICCICANCALITCICMAAIVCRVAGAARGGLRADVGEVRGLGRPGTPGSGPVPPTPSMQLLPVVTPACAVTAFLFAAASIAPATN